MGIRHKHNSSVEILTHYQCGKCIKWWSIGDAPKDKKEWYCPWCGTKSDTKKKGG
jgi:DNA-directed RNA polymerase subunit RPC12/RpoP